MTASLDPFYFDVLDTERLVQLVIHHMGKERVREILKMTSEEQIKLHDDIVHTVLVYLLWSANEEKRN